MGWSSWVHQRILLLKTLLCNHLWWLSLLLNCFIVYVGSFEPQGGWLGGWYGILKALLTFFYLEWSWMSRQTCKVPDNFLGTISILFRCSYQVTSLRQRLIALNVAIQVISSRKLHGICRWFKYADTFAGSKLFLKLLLKFFLSHPQVFTSLPATLAQFDVYISHLLDFTAAVFPFRDCDWTVVFAVIDFLRLRDAIGSRFTP